MNVSELPGTFGRTSVEFSIFSDDGRKSWTETVPPSTLDEMVDLIADRILENNALVGSHAIIGGNVLVEHGGDYLSFYPSDPYGQWADDPALLVDAWE